MLIPITLITTLVLTLIFLGLSERVMSYRRQKLIAYGDGGDSDLMRRVRAHSNFTEYVPIGILLILVLEINKTPANWLSLPSISLITGRLLHAYALGSDNLRLFFRISGMLLTLTSIIFSAALIVSNLINTYF